MLLKIVRSWPPDAEFVSRCHTAAITEASKENKALHLTSATRYCVFQRVVGTMWEIVNTDGLAKGFYKSRG